MTDTTTSAYTFKSLCDMYGDLRPMTLLLAAVSSVRYNRMHSRQSIVVMRPYGCSTPIGTCRVDIVI